MFTTWATPSAGFWGLLCGMLASIAHNFAVRCHVVTYGSQMLANFYGTIYGMDNMHRDNLSYQHLH